MITAEVLIRPIQPGDDAALATIIRNTLAEFGANKPGTVYYDPTTDHLSNVFIQPGSAYFVAQLDARIVGGAGIYPTDGLTADTCELVKMYLLPTVRGKGLGKQLIEHCIAFARQYGYKKIYLETMPELAKAVSIYEKSGFKRLAAPLGHSGHFGCDIWMLKEL